MLNTAGKLLEMIIADRLEAVTESPAGLADSQFGFRKGRSTIDAIQKVLSTAKAAINGKRYHRGTKKYCVFVTLDVKNAFNSARWNHILSAFEKMGVPPYLRRLIASYFSDRVLEYSTDDGAETYSITAGVPQRSVLGPILWNAMYNKILGLRLPSTVSGRWTHRLIPSIATWIERRHGEVKYHLTRLLSGHSCFRSYLCGIKNDTSSSCPTCHPAVEDVEHVIFHCPRFTAEREELYRLANGPLEPETFVGFMLENERNWEATSSFASLVMTRLRSEEKARRR
ncbi:unnamed protein product [Trichogramma brassicae]|uniref:Reverse transcriptase domain-containing protein n=1 Tax=Trichogramma brassicae TaxID=86971 RepID=A0A6H5IS32_9HYME|nr:unnamed protein product [Trichogramma brassicae]